MAPYSLSGVIQNYGSPEVSILIWKDVIYTVFKNNSLLLQLS